MTDNPSSDKIAQLEQRIASGDYGTDFHLFVQNEIYPLIVDEEITLEQFTGLVQRYAALSSPFKIINR